MKIINLRRERKNRTRAARREEANASATRHGLSKGEKHLTEVELDRAQRELEGHRLDDADT